MITLQRRRGLAPIQERKREPTPEQQQEKQQKQLLERTNVPQLDKLSARRELIQSPRAARGSGAMVTLEANLMIDAFRSQALAQALGSVEQSLQQARNLGSAWQSVKAQALRANPALEPLMREIEAFVRRAVEESAELARNEVFLTFAQGIEHRARERGEELRESEIARRALLIERMVRGEASRQRRATTRPGRRGILRRAKLSPAMKRARGKKRKALRMAKLREWLRAQGRTPRQRSLLRMARNLYSAQK